ncbi:E3 ubiquitin-protein ligase DTX3L-like [Cololabis saira]|uniref:E3 ubiquitin-protein ligase DTX3L-like n=1 Tax=Cololabis saira TaxID=129043 RepID=UPI002AD4BE30|nr:E3 ubiquitin-protein ligase DTX3L-like [Cololabis saira]
MGSGHSSQKVHCNRFLNGEGPPSVLQQVHSELNGDNRASRSSQPEGQMTWVVLHKDLPGFSHDDTLQISFTFPGRTQTENLPHPGQPFSEKRVLAYLPENREGRKVLKLLEKAFQQQLLFTSSSSKPGEDVVITATVPLKTQPEGGSIVDGYPDCDYLKTVTKTLRDKGVK